MQNEAAAKLVTDSKVLINDAKDLVKARANDVGSRIGELRERLGKKFEDSKSALTDGKKNWRETVDCAKTQTESYLREHAWASLLVAVGVGAPLGERTVTNASPMPSVVSVSSMS